MLVFVVDVGISVMFYCCDTIFCFYCGNTYISRFVLVIVVIGNI